jgi:tetratricopeptide (TPR) repeat protein
VENAVKKIKMAVISKSLLTGILLLACAMVTAQEALNEKLGQLVSSGDYAEALALIAEAAQAEGADRVALDLLKGSVLVRMGKLDEGMALFQALAKQHPNDAALFNNIGVIHAQRGEVYKAKEAFERALEISPDHQQALYNLGDLYVELACRTYGRISQPGAGGIPVYCESVDYGAGTAKAPSAPETEPTPAEKEPPGIPPKKFITGKYVINLLSLKRPVDVKKIAPVSLPEGKYLYTTEAEVDGEIWYRLRIGFYPTLTDARQGLEAIRKIYASSWIAIASAKERQQITGYIPVPREAPN